MQAILQSEYGDPAVLRLADVPQPVPTADQVRVRVHAASVDAGVWHLMRGEPFLVRLVFGGWWRPKHPILGAAIAGTVDAVGETVTQFQPGDAVMGDLSESGFGGFAEYVCAPAVAFAPKPANLNWDAAAALPVSGLAALQGLREGGLLLPNQSPDPSANPAQPRRRVLVVGAAGGVGSLAVQMAAAAGAEVTGVCSRAKLDRVQALALPQILDYTDPALLQPSQPYDLILDTAAYRPFADYLPALGPGGTYVMVGGSTGAFFRALLRGGNKGQQRQVKCLASQPNPADLRTLQQLAETGQLTPLVDRTYPLAQVPQAIHDLEQRQIAGKAVINLSLS